MGGTHRRFRVHNTFIFEFSFRFFLDIFIHRRQASRSMAVANLSSQTTCFNAIAWILTFLGSSSLHYVPGEEDTPSTRYSGDDFPNVRRQPRGNAHPAHHRWDEPPCSRTRAVRGALRQAPQHAPNSNSESAIFDRVERERRRGSPCSTISGWLRSNTGVQRQSLGARVKSMLGFARKTLWIPEVGRRKLHDCSQNERGWCLRT